MEETEALRSEIAELRRKLAAMTDEARVANQRANDLDAKLTAMKKEPEPASAQTELPFSEVVTKDIDQNTLSTEEQAWLDSIQTMLGHRVRLYEERQNGVLLRVCLVFRYLPWREEGVRDSVVRHEPNRFTEQRPIIHLLRDAAMVIRHQHRPDGMPIVWPGKDFEPRRKQA